ncbi:threonine synthase-like 2 [Tubulanus polymorphus]|uniref:threonine synthase-like 2 n=1 Tax=Tubulanus polymorphus TaxID=672921 RepID=UPI003DA1EAB7
MKYCSIRSDKYKGLTFEEAIFKGFPDDAGLILPEEIPTVTDEQLCAWSKLSYPGVVKEIASLFIDETEIPRTTLNGLIDKAFTKFRHPEITPLVQLKDGVQIFELFHGQTMAFKDLALSCVGQFLEFYLTRNKRHFVALVGTSGDTGSSAIEGVRGLNSVDIIVILPKGRCSAIQELQMTTAISDNVHVYRLDGTSDDLDEPISKCFMDKDFVDRYGIFSINSVNWARIMVQISHFVYAYLQAKVDRDTVVEIVVPSGGCGNITAGCIARLMGVPIKLVAAVNVNDIVCRFINNGDFTKCQTVTPTVAPSMDIQYPYNVPRLIYLLSNRNTKLLNQLIKEHEADGKMSIPSDLLEKIKSIFSAFRCDDELIKKTIKRCYEENEYILCPHTAVGMAYHYHQLSLGINEPNFKRIVVATASPEKFPEVAREAGISVPQSVEIRSLYEKPTRYIDMEKGQDWEHILRTKIMEIHEMRQNKIDHDKN